MRIQPFGKHTQALLAYVQQHGAPRIRVDGPYGQLSVNPRKYETLLLCAGGVGVTPMMAMLRAFFLFQMSPEQMALESKKRARARISHAPVE